MNIPGRLFAGLLLVGFNCVTIFAKDVAWVTQLEEPYFSLYQQLVKDPYKVREQLLADPPNENSWQVQKAQYYLILSLANDFLTYPKPSIEAAEKGLLQVYEQQQPWLFHFLQMSKAAALDLGGTPSDGLGLTIRALAWAEEQQDRELIVFALTMRGRIFNSMLNYNAALNDFQRAYSLTNEDASVMSKGSIANSIGMVYESRAEGQLALPYLEESVIYHRKHDNALALSMALFGLGRSNKYLGNAEIGIQQFEESADIARSINDDQGVAYVLMELAELEFFQNNFEKAELMYIEAQSVFEKAQNNYLRSDVWQQLARLALIQKNIDKAEQYLANARELVDPMEMRLQQQNLELISAEIHAAKKEYKEAYQGVREVLSTWDEVFDEQSLAQLHQLRTQYEISTKEKENKILERDNELQKISLLSETRKKNFLLMLFVSSLIIFLLFLFWFYRYRQHKRDLEILASTDELTGIYNRRKALELSEYQIQLANRHNHMLCLALLDLDHFKAINDTYGHQVGDLVLSRLGKLFKVMLRQTDIVGRVGGEEFLIVLPHTSLIDSYRLLNNLRVKVQELSEGIDAEGLTVSISIGLKNCIGNDSMSVLIAEADKLLYQAKHNGRNRLEVDDREMIDIKRASNTSSS